MYEQILDAYNTIVFRTTIAHHYQSVLRTAELWLDSGAYRFFDDGKELLGDLQYILRTERVKS